VARRIIAIALAGERGPINIYVNHLRHLGPLAPPARIQEEQFCRVRCPALAPHCAS
jgi:hypothetical protein